MKRLKILIAEDNDEVRGLYNKALKDEMFEKIFVTNGEDALDEYQSQKPDIVLLDIKMPVKSGYQTLKEIRQDMGDDSTVIIMATALSREDDVKNCLALGIQGYLVKPLNHRTLADKIFEYYEKAQDRKGPGLTG